VPCRRSTKREPSHCRKGPSTFSRRSLSLWVAPPRRRARHLSDSSRLAGGRPPKPKLGASDTAVVGNGLEDHDPEVLVTYEVAKLRRREGGAPAGLHHHRRSSQALEGARRRLGSLAHTAGDADSRGYSCTELVAGHFHAVRRRRAGDRTRSTRRASPSALQRRRTPRRPLRRHPRPVQPGRSRGTARSSWGASDPIPTAPVATPGLFASRRTEAQRREEAPRARGGRETSVRGCQGSATVLLRQRARWWRARSSHAYDWSTTDSRPSWPYADRIESGGGPVGG